MSRSRTRLAAPAPGSARPRRARRATAARHRTSRQPRPPQSHGGPSSWTVWWPSSPAPVLSPRSGAPPRRGRRRGPYRGGRRRRSRGAGPQGEAQGGGVGVLVEDDGEAEAAGQLRADRVAGPLGKPVTRPGTPARWSRGRAWRPRRRGRSAPPALPEQRPHLLRDRVQDRPGPAPRSTGRRRRSHGRAREVGQEDRQLVAVEVDADGVRGGGTRRRTVRGLPPVEARWPASVARPSARSRAVILLTACGVSPVRSASSRRLIPVPPAPRSRSSTSAALRVRGAGAGAGAGVFAPSWSFFTPPLSPLLALWQRRCLSEEHDWHRLPRTPSASDSSATASRAPSSTPR